MLQIDWKLVREEIDAADHGQKAVVIAGICQRYGVSSDTIYRGIRAQIGPRREIHREKQIPDHLVREVALMKMRGMKMQIDERELSTEICIRKMVARGVPGAENLRASTVNSRLVEMGFRMRDPVTRYEASFANQLHEMDFTRSKYFQLAGHDNGEWLLKVSGKELHYKQDDRRLRLWIVSLVDSFSRAELSRGYPATSESEDLGLTHLHWAYCRPEDDHVVRYMPFIFKTDQGSFGKSSAIRDAFERLEIRTDFSRPYSKRGIQKVESSHRRRWQQFELAMAVDLGEGTTIKLAEYNELLLEKTIEDLEQLHPARKGTKRSVYLASVAANPPRELDGDLREIVFRVYERKVADTLLVSINSETFRCPEYSIGKTVRVYRNMMGEFVGHLVEEERKPFTLVPAKGFVELDDYSHRPHATFRQEIATEVEKEKREKIKDKRQTKNDEHTAKQLFLPARPKKIKPKTVFDDATETRETFPNAYAARVYIGKNLPAGETYADYEEIFDELISSDLSRASIDAVLKELRKRIAM